jgi:hypothetical protein
MNHLEKQEWQSFKNISENFLGNIRGPHDQDTVRNWLGHFNKLGCNVATQLHS